MEPAAGQNFELTQSNMSISTRWIGKHFNINGSHIMNLHDFHDSLLGEQKQHELWPTHLCFPPAGAVFPSVILQFWTGKKCMFFSLHKQD